MSESDHLVLSARSISPAFDSLEPTVGKSFSLFVCRCRHLVDVSSRRCALDRTFAFASFSPLAARAIRSHNL